MHRERMLYFNAFFWVGLNGNIAGYVNQQHFFPELFYHKVSCLFWLDSTSWVYSKREVLINIRKVVVFHSLH